MTNSDTFPLVTIITACYKKFDRVFETIKSVLGQDYPNVEYIIADDGSPNFPEKDIVDYIAKNAPNACVKIFRSIENRGTVKNLNNAIKNSNGEYIFPLSCGDVFFIKDVVSRIVDRFFKTGGSVIVATRVFYHDDYEPVCFLPHYLERKIIAKYDTVQKQYEAFITNRYFDMASGSAMYYTRAVLEELGYFDERYVLWEDGPFLAKYLAKYPLVFAYDIISIWYEYGGVSTENVKNTLLLRDEELFAKTEYVPRNLAMLSDDGRKRIEYVQKFLKPLGMKDRIMVYFKYLSTILSNKMILFSRFIYAKLDMYYICKLKILK